MYESEYTVTYLLFLLQVTAKLNNIVAGGTIALAVHSLYFH